MNHNEVRDQRRGVHGTVDARKRWRARPTLVALEERTLLSTIVVNNPTDTPVAGQTDLRQAIVLANTTGGDQTIVFDSTVFKTPQTITLAGTQLELTDTTGTETITGPAAGVTISGGGNSRVFQVDSGVAASISGMTITGGNVGTSKSGGGLYDDGGTTTLTNCTVSSNSALRGGGLMINGGTTTLTDSTVSGNRASGAGLFDLGGTLTLSNCTVSGNLGVGLSNFALGSITLTDSTVSGNTSDGLDNLHGTTALTDSTVSGNSSVGVYNRIGATALTNCTVSGNKEGIINRSGATVTLGNTIVAANTSSDVSGVFASQGNNLIGETRGSSGWVGSDLTGTSAQPLNARLAPLGHYGGPTQTMALLPGSPAIDAGSSGPGIPTTDQRGEGRVGAVDTGAFESQGFDFTFVPGSTPQTAMIGTAFANPLAVSVTANNPVEPLNGGVVTFVANPATNGATAYLLASSAVIANDQAAVTAAPNNMAGTYHVAASASGSSPVSFDLTNTGPVFAKLIVSTTSDSLFPGAGLLSLREAIVFANIDRSGNSTITFDPNVFKTPQTITLKGTQLELSNTSETETITGPNKGVTVSGGGLSRVFQIEVGVTASISGLTITGATTTGNGGGLYNDGGTTTLTNCTVSGNSAAGNGGGVMNSGGTITMTNSTLSQNSGYGGGGLFSSGTATLSNCTVSGNSATGFFGGSGGGVATGNLLEGGPSLTTMLNNCTISGNTASGLFGGGGGVSNYGSTTLNNCTVSGNSAPNANGGGLWSFGPLFGVGYGSITTTTLNNCTVTDNTASSGGGVATQGVLGGTNYGIVKGDTTSILNNCTVSGNTATGNGGGMATGADGTTTLTNTTVSGNFAVDGGGLATSGFAYYGNNYGTTNLTNCTVSGNSATGNGGGMYNASLGKTTLTGTTVSRNSAVAGGGIFNQAALNVSSSNIINNRASGGAGGDGIGGGILSNGGSLTLTNSALTSNTAIGGAGARGGAGGDGIGGGLALENNSTATVTNTTFTSNLAKGGTGGSGANGGAGIGGGIAVAIGSIMGTPDTSSLTLSGCTLTYDVAQGGSRGAGANGGSGWGGGIFVGAGGSALIQQASIAGNQAIGGLSGGSGDGDGLGGGLYVATGATVSLKKTNVWANFTNTSDRDIYGTVIYL